MTNTYDMLLNPPPSKTTKTENTPPPPPPTPVKPQSSKKKTKAAAPQHQATTVATKHDTMLPRHHDTMTPLVVETVRKAVKQVGKEAATHRFTEEEKRAIADIVYTYERQKFRTSENEITRIAVNWLLLDYAEHGKNSVLARLLDALHE